MRISRRQIASVLADFTLDKSVKQQDLSREIAAYLLTENRAHELDSLMRDIIEYRAEEGIVEVTAVSAHELSPAIMEDIKNQVKQRYPKAKEIIINRRKDASVVGGMRLELVGRQLDLSVRAKLNRLKQLTAKERTA